MEDTLMVIMRWSQYLSVNDRYERGTRPKLRPECAAWQEELAWRVKEQWAHSTMVWADDATLVIDIEMRFPEDCRDRDADNYFKSILDGLEAGLGVSDSRMIPYVRSREVVPADQAGFTIIVYDASFSGHGLRGRFRMLRGLKTCIVLDEAIPPAWLNQRVIVSVGFVMTEEV